MSIVVHQTNPLDPTERTVEELEHPISVRSLLHRWDIREFSAPTVCLVNGQPVLRKDWATTVLYRADICVFLTLPAGGGGGQGGSSPLRIVIMVIILIIVIVVTWGVGAAAAGGALGSAFGAGGTMTAAGAALSGIAGAAVGAGLTALVNTFLPVEGPENQDFETSNTYSLYARNNMARPGAPIPVHYGRVRFFPEMVAQPFSYYPRTGPKKQVWWVNPYTGQEIALFVTPKGLDNTLTLEMLFCLGQGEFDVHEIRVGDRLIDDLPDAEYEILPPGQQPTLAPYAIYHCQSVNNLHVEGVDWVGPYPINPAGTRVDELGAIFVMPQGVYELDTKHGGYNRHALQGVIEYRLIDDAGAPLGAWTSATLELAPSSRGETAPRYRHYTVAVPAGRYEVRFKRSTPVHTDGKKFDNLVWVSAYGKNTQDHPDYGNVTLLAVRLVANDSLSGGTPSRVSVLATRKLKTWTPDTGWSAPVTTRSAVWAIADILMAAYGGRMTDAALDLNRLHAVELFSNNNGFQFDYRYDTSGTLMEAATLAAATSRSRVYLQGGVLRIVADTPPTLPVALFTPQNTVKDSMTVEVALFNDQRYDSIEVEYFSEDTWQFETVLCHLDEVPNPQRPRRMRLPGIQTAAHAHNMGMYHLASDRYRRIHVQFETGLEGHIPVLGDSILVSLDALDWVSSGTLYGLNGTTLILSDPVDFKGNPQGKLRFRGKDGLPSVEIDVIPGGTPYEVEIVDVTAIDLSGAYFANNHRGRDPSPYVFGLVSTTQHQCKVVDVQPVTDMRLKVTAVVDDIAVYAAPASIPVPQRPPLEPPPSTFAFGNLGVAPLSVHAWAYRLFWHGVGYDRYVVYLSYDNADFVPAGTTVNSWWDLMITDPNQPKPVNAMVVPVCQGHLYFQFARYLYDTADGKPGSQGQIEVIGAPQGLEVL